ncbi:SusC/RagA family TonB-linked outer membrane protein [Mucilaginibacter robiniae]|uniref:SusC/RagA family TonB-linked outer membrane protein n=1 Tax=Mucilaginibacter robiniae TaxID=2728022 RepID=A0A7L5DVY1_9SPHI|nr:SusC/RagA family TonB-linked outer membrane protein [Mucilaginibacter robiniae]QJD95250.1 SusC/RagA family TonB-linked outer membrane protein [Mucilaginibacter robiniae]
MKQIFTTLLCLFLFLQLFQPAPVYAQAPDKILIKGRVIDQKDKQPVIGATVVEQDNDKRTVAGAATDINGNFAIKVSSTTHKLSFSFIGYNTKVLDIGERRIFNVNLESSSRTLTEVNISGGRRVNNGTGLNVDERNRTTASVTVSGKDVEELQATTIDQAIQGRMPGVDIVANSGDPGAGMSIRIRGTSTINGNTNPLIVVDGIPFETTIPSDFNFATADDTQYANLLSIAPSDIRDITVLKDAAATAVWGSRAANGVLVINTKRGVQGPPTITYTFKGSISKLPSALPMLSGDQYSTLIPQEVMNVTGAPLNTFTVKEFEYDPQDSYYYYNYSKNTDWVKAVTRNGYVNDNNLSISGGGEKARYFASVGYTGQRGTIIGTGLDRLNTRVNLDYIVSSRIHFTTYLAYTHSSTQANFASSKSDNILGEAYLKMPNMSIYEYNENGVLTPNYFSPASNIQGQYTYYGLGSSGVSIYNPVAMANSAINKTVDDRVTPHFNLSYSIIPNILTATSDVQFDVDNSKNNQFLPQTATGRPITETSVNRAYNYDYDVFNVQSKTNFIYTPRLNEKHTFQGLLSLQTYDNKIVTQSVQTANTASTTLQDPSTPSRIQNSDLGIASGTTETRSVAALINGQYSFLDRYILNVGLRGDGNSRFGANHRYGLFPSVSARYRFSGEPFMKRFDNWLDDLSFRASYGQSGNAPKYDYLFYNTYTNYAYNYMGLSGVYPANIQLDNLRWETIVGTNLGFNLIMFKNRVNIDMEFYRNRTKNLFTDNLQISSFNGYNSVSLNVGTMDNQGFEFSIFTTPYKSKKLVIDFNFNIAHNYNVLRSISPYYPNSSGNTTLNGNYLSLLQVGNPLGSFYGYKYKGVYKDAAATIAKDKNGNPIISPDGTPVQMRFNYPSTNYIFQPGDAQYEDINHDGNIDAKDVVYLGNGNPKVTGGFGPTFTYNGNLKLTAFFNYRLGGQIINQTKMQTTNMYSFNNQSTAVLRRWQNIGDVTDMPRALYNSGYNWLGSDRYVEDGSFLRVRSITLRYTLAQRVARQLGLKNISAYVTAENLYTFTKYTGQDPEVASRGNGIFSLVQDNSTTPPAKIFTLGLTATL